MSDHFIIPKKYYQVTLAVLLVLTIFTVVVSKIELGILNTPVAILVACVKATFVGAFFMGLRWEKANLIFVFGSIAAVILFFLFTFADIAYRGEISDEVVHPFTYKSPVKVVTEHHKGGHH